MTLHTVAAEPPSELAAALSKFEAQFTYPLGPERSFRISHGRDYSRFYRAMGEAACFVAERDGVIDGTLGVAIRTVAFPNGSERGALYLGDLKVAPGGRAGRTLATLAQAAEHWAAPRVQSAFCVVMDGTRVTPQRYTGRLGIPPFHEIGKIAVIRLDTAAHSADVGRNWDATVNEGTTCFRQLSSHQCAAIGSRPEERSEHAPLWLVEPSGSACGRLEDTRLAKRLFTDDGAEMLCAHLSDFAFRDAKSGAALLRAALDRAAQRGFPAMFVAVAESQVVRNWAESEVVIAPATVFGTGLEPGHSWNINSAEI
jgi:hypothetical protein